MTRQMETLNPEPTFVKVADHKPGQLLAKGIFHLDGVDQKPGKYNGSRFFQIRDEDNDDVCYQLPGHQNLCDAIDTKGIKPGRYIEVYLREKVTTKLGNPFYKYRVCAEVMAEPVVEELPEVTEEEVAKAEEKPVDPKLSL